MTTHYKKRPLSQFIEKGDFDYLLQDDIFQSLVSSTYLSDYLYIYFSNQRRYSENFERRLAKQKPDIFIQFIRTQQYFLNEKRIDSLLNLPLSGAFSYHQKIWKTLQDQELILWKEIQKELIPIKQLPIEEVLIYTVLWIENARFHSGGIEKISHLADVYSFFIELYLSESKIPHSFQAAEQSFYNLFLSSARKLNNPLSKVFKAISDWITFNITILHEYCYDLEAQPAQRNGLIGITKTPTSFYQWQVDEVRYKLGKLSYQLRAESEFNFIQSQIDRPSITEGEKYDEYCQKELQFKQSTNEFFLSDLNIDALVLGKKNIPISDLLPPLLQFSTKLLYHYEYPIDWLKNSQHNWFDAYIKACNQQFSKKNKIDPWILQSYDRKLNNSFSQEEKLQGISLEISNDLYGLFSHKINNKYPFDRFKAKYNVWEKPFIRLGKMLFCPTAFLANNDWFYGFAQAGLNNIKPRYAVRVRKPSATKMENYLAELFENKGFQVKCFNDKEANAVDGDVDILVKDQNTTLLIQLKRTFFRLKLRDQYHEQLHVDQKAVQQLNDAEQFLSKENEIFFLEGQSVKWIVTTSFEGIGKTIGGCKKVNYFDLLRILHNPNPQSLNEIINNIHRDKVLLEWDNHLHNPNHHPWLHQQIYSAGLPIPIQEPKQLFKPITFEKEEVAREHAQVYEKALALDKADEKEKAIELFHKCLEVYPDDLDIFSALGNTYADIKDFEKAFECFEKALQIVPFDPFISKNYIVALYENGNYVKGAKMAFQLYHQYPLLEDFRQLEEGYIRKFIVEGKLSTKELHHLIEWFKSHAGLEDLNIDIPPF